MPIYEYKCPSCQLKFEVLRPLSQADEPAVCPACHNPGARRCISIFAAFSKGSSGNATAITGSACSGCAATSCSACGR